MLVHDADPAAEQLPLRDLARRIVAGAPLLVLALLVLQRLDAPLLIDYEVYRWAHGRWAAGLPFTGGSVVTSVGIDLPWVYPPFAVLALAPFTALGYAPGAAFLHAAGLAGLWVAVFLVLGRRPGLGDGRRVALSAALAAAGVVVLEPVRATLGLGQVNLVLMGLVAADLLSRRTRWPRGLLLGIAIGIKLTPAVFLLLLLVRRDVRTAAVATGTALLTAVVGVVAAPADSLAYWWSAGPASAVGNTPYLANQSLWGALLRLDLDAGAALAARVVLIALALVATVTVLRRADAAVGLLSTAALGLIASPTSWVDHWVWAAPALALLVVQQSGPAATTAGRALTGAAVAVFALTPLRSVRPAGAPSSRGHPSSTSSATRSCSRRSSRC